MPRVSITAPGQTQQPYRFKLSKQKVTFGRSSENDIIIDCPSVSSHHCVMERVKGGFILRDLNSTNGIKSYGDLMEIIELEDGGDVWVGDAALEFTLTSEENTSLIEEGVERYERKKTPAPRPTAPEERKPEKVTPVASSTNSDANFLTYLLLFLIGFSAFSLGLKLRYEGAESRNGRENPSLVTDILDGRPTSDYAAEKSDP